MTRGDTAPEVLHVEDFWFRYPSAQDAALKGIELSVRSGEVVGILGASGAGKSTLCQAIKGLIPHSSPGEVDGRVRAFGEDITSEHRLDIGARIGLVLQDPEAQIIGMTVAEDLAFGPENYEVDPAVIAERSVHYLALVGLAGLMDRDTYALSGGQKQRLAIASALMSEPELLILDEPTSELDPVGKEQLFRVIEGLRRGGEHTVLVVEHEVDRLVRVADRIVIMQDGQIAVQGSSLEVFFGPGADARTASERMPAAADLLSQLVHTGALADPVPTLDLDLALDQVMSALGAQR